MTKEDAIKIIKDWNLDNDKIEVLSVIIPELKESEDEKIRKQLLNWFKDCNWDAIDNGTLKRDDIIAWLEKQGEQKADKCEDCNNVKGCITCTDGDQYAHIKEYNSAWSEEDKENISMLIDLVESKEESMEVKIELSTWLKSLKDRMQLQPTK